MCHICPPFALAAQRVPSSTSLLQRLIIHVLDLNGEVLLFAVHRGGGPLPNPAVNCFPVPVKGRAQLMSRPSLYSQEPSRPRGDSLTFPAASRSWWQRGTCPWLQAPARGTGECCLSAADKR